jgi:CBS domain-containing membrane protein
LQLARALDFVFVSSAFPSASTREESPAKASAVSLARVSEQSHRVILGAAGVAAFMVALTLIDEITRGSVSLPALVPPFGASVVIVFFTPESPLGRAWNVIVGHLSCALVAAVVLALFPDASTGVLAALAVSGAGLLMLATKSFHPPGGATALLAVIAEKKLGFVMMICPMLVGAVALSATRALLDVAISAAPLKRAFPAATLQADASAVEARPSLVDAAPAEPG